MIEVLVYILAYPIACILLGSVFFGFSRGIWFVGVVLMGAGVVGIGVGVLLAVFNPPAPTDAQGGLTWMLNIALTWVATFAAKGMILAASGWWMDRKVVERRGFEVGAAKRREEKSG